MLRLGCPPGTLLALNCLGARLAICRIIRLVHHIAMPGASFLPALAAALVLPSLAALPLAIAVIARPIAAGALALPLPLLVVIAGAVRA